MHLGRRFRHGAAHFQRVVQLGDDGSTVGVRRVVAGTGLGVHLGAVGYGQIVRQLLNDGSLHLQMADVAIQCASHKLDSALV